MSRVNDAEVKQIIDTTIDTTPFITVANFMVTNNCTGADVAVALSDTELKEIERWLAAHLVCMRDPRETEVKALSSAKFQQGQLGEMLKSTFYGQQVLAMDRTKALATATMQEKQAKLSISPAIEDGV